MFPTSRFSFGQPTNDAAQKLFDNSHQLNIQMSRGGRHCGPLLCYELHGAFADRDGDLQEIARELLAAFGQLPKIGGDDDEADTDSDD